MTVGVSTFIMRGFAYHYIYFTWLCISVYLFCMALPISIFILHGMCVSVCLLCCIMCLSKVVARLSLPFNCIFDLYIDKFSPGVYH